MRVLAARAAGEGDTLPLGQPPGAPRHLSGGGASDGGSPVNRKYRFIRRRCLRYVRWDDQHRDTALGQRRLRRHRSPAPGLRRRTNLVAENAATRIDRLEVVLLRKVEPGFVADDLAGDQNHRRTIAMALEEA